MNRLTQIVPTDLTPLFFLLMVASWPLQASLLPRHNQDEISSFNTTANDRSIFVLPSMEEQILGIEIKPPSGTTASTSTSSLNTHKATCEFSIPKEGYHFSFPRDYGSHNDFKIEWWYITGHLFTQEGRRFGFEATFFRTALQPLPKVQLEGEHDFGTQMIFFADMALLDVQKQKFLFQRRWNRNGWDASASSKKLDLHNGNWSLLMHHLETMSLSGSIQGEASFQLILTPILHTDFKQEAAKPDESRERNMLQPGRIRLTRHSSDIQTPAMNRYKKSGLIIFGKNSVSRKGEDPAALSYYMTFPRLQVTGTLFDGTQEQQVHGEAWMDHEVSSSQLASNQVGWDWCSLQLKEGVEIMAYRMRRSDGTQDPFSTLTWIDSDGKLTSFTGKEFSIEPVRYWKSPMTHIRYPISIRLHTIDPKNNRPATFLLVPLAENQELVGTKGLNYWEGACRVLDHEDHEVGSAFLELTGYDSTFQKNLH